MASPTFRFKQFTIRHDRSAMKVGTDGVLLGAWASVGGDGAEARNVLDVGTGTGLIALMLAQRFPNAFIKGIDIDEASLEQAKENVKESPFSAQITIEEQDFNNINSPSKKYHAIVSNPPFYQEDTLGGDEARDAARHTISLPFEKLIGNCAKLLHSEGVFSVILPYSEASHFIALCAQEKLYLARRMDVRSTPRKAPNRTLLEFTFKVQPTQTETLTLYDTCNQRTPEYTQLTQDFYL